MAQILKATDQALKKKTFLPFSPEVSIVVIIIVVANTKADTDTDNNGDNDEKGGEKTDAGPFLGHGVRYGLLAPHNHSDAGHVGGQRLLHVFLLVFWRWGRRPFIFTVDRSCVVVDVAVAAFKIAERDRVRAILLGWCFRRCHFFRR